MHVLLPIDGVAGCNCCTPAPLLAWHALAHTMSSVLSQVVQKEDKIVDEGGEDAFLGEELSIAAALSTAWADRGGKARDILLDSTRGGFRPTNFQMAVDEASALMETLYDDAAEVVEAAIPATIATGAAAISGEAASLIEIISAQRFREGIIAATRYTTNRYFNTFILPEIIKGIDAATFGTEAATLEAIQAAIAVHFRTVPYWQIVANVGASRGYHYGMLKTMEQRGILGYRLQAVLDHRTSAVCRELHGREFLASEGVNVLEALADDPDPQAAKSRTPWVSADIVRGQSSRDLAAMGVLVPPFHPYCRTTLIPIG